MEEIPRGEFVLDYRGEVRCSILLCRAGGRLTTFSLRQVIELSEYYARIQTVYKGRQDYYALEYGEGEVLDSGMKGNIARFINRSSPDWRKSSPSYLC